MLGYGLADQGSESRQEQRILAPPEPPDCLSALQGLLFSGYRSSFFKLKRRGREAEHSHLQPKLRICGALRPLPHTPSLRAQGQLYFYPRRVSAVAIYPDCFCFFKHEP
jgi:hypothetical protein